MLGCALGCAVEQTWWPEQVMYTTLSRGSSRLTATRNSRRGPSQQLERFDRDTTTRRDLPPESSAMRTGRRAQGLMEGRDSSGYSTSPQAQHKSSPKPVFNGKRSYSRQNSSNMTQEPFSQQHEESVRYVADAWSQVKQKYEVSSRQGREGPEYYQEKVPNQMQGFEPFDLDQWLEKRTLQKIQQST